MSDRRTAIQDELNETRAYLESILDQVEDRWETPVYSDGLEWTIRQIVTHLADAEKGHWLQAKNIAEGKDIIPEDFDLERYNRRQTEKSAERTVESAHHDLETHRQGLLDWLFTITDEALDAKGRHATLRIMSVEEILLHLANHERTHAEDIARALDIQ